MKDLNHYSILAELFQYPSEDYPERVRSVQVQLKDRWPKAATELERFIDLLPEDNLVRMQELFIRSFDVQAVTTLDIGYVLFGDDYKRGELLSNLNREHIAAKVDCGHELSDHLPNVLRLLSRLAEAEPVDTELIDELAKQIIAPAVNRMTDEFSIERVQKKNESYKKHYKTLIEAPADSAEASTLYKFTLKCLFEVLIADFGVTAQIPVVMTSDFLQSISTENEIEEAAHEFY
jgi:nitrate reductase assembly molybdenum cofactor insertion protein NarJ